MGLSLTFYCDHCGHKAGPYTESHWMGKRPIQSFVIENNRVIINRDHDIAVVKNGRFKMTRGPTSGDQVPRDVPVPEGEYTCLLVSEVTEPAAKAVTKRCGKRVTDERGLDPGPCLLPKGHSGECQ